MKRLLFIISAILLCAVTSCEDSTIGSIVITSKSEMSISMYGGRATITYTTKGDVSPEDVNVSTTSEWLKIVDAKHLGEVVIMAETNETGGTRMAAVTITVGAQAQTIVVNQSGTPDDPIITPTSASEVSIDRAGQDVVITYTVENKSPEGYTYAKFDAAWIYSIDTSIDGEVKLLVATNNTDISRTANVEVGYGNASFNVTITQSGEGDYNFTATQLSGEYYGDAYTPGAGNYWMILSDRGFTSDGKSQPFGTYYRIDAYGTVYSGNDTMIPIPEGEYTYDPDNKYASWTFAAEYTSFFVNDKDGNHEKLTIDSGKMLVKGDSITLDLVINGEKHTVEYTGELSLPDARGDVNILTTLTEDYALDLSNHTMVYACEGDYYEFGYYNWMFVIKPISGTGDCIQMDIITAYTDKESGFAGDYVASDVLAASSFIYGWTQTSEEGVLLQCSWFHTADFAEIAPMRGGEVKVKHNDDGTYTVDINVTDDLRNRIYGTWTGSATEHAK